MRWQVDGSKRRGPRTCIRTDRREEAWSRGGGQAGGTSESSQRVHPARGCGWRRGGHGAPGSWRTRGCPIYAQPVLLCEAEARWPGHSCLLASRAAPHLCSQTALTALPQTVDPTPRIGTLVLPMQLACPRSTPGSIADTPPPPPSPPGQHPPRLGAPEATLSFASSPPAPRQ